MISCDCLLILELLQGDWFEEGFCVDKFVKRLNYVCITYIVTKPHFH